MNEFLKTLLAVVGGSAIVTTFAIPILKHLFQKAVESNLKKHEELFQARLEIDKESAGLVRKNELAILPALSELVYKAKVGADRIREARLATDLLNGDLTEACRELTTRLYSYRIFLSSDLFEKLHEYKHSLQDIVVFCDSRTRLETLKKAPTEPLSADDRLLLANLCRKIRTLCDEIIKSLRESMQARTKLS